VMLDRTELFTRTRKKVALVVEFGGKTDCVVKKVSTSMHMHSIYAYVFVPCGQSPIVRLA